MMYLTKYATKIGIIAVKAEQEFPNGYVSYRNEGFRSFAAPGEYFYHLSDAIQSARDALEWEAESKEAQICGLRRQIAALREEAAIIRQRKEQIPVRKYDGKGRWPGRDPIYK